MLALFQMRHSRTLPRMRHVRKGDAVSRMDARRIDHETSRISGVARCSGRITAGPGASGQTLVEFAFIIPIFLLLMLGVVQMVVVGGAALAVNQAALSCARYASLNPSATQGTVATYLSGTASPLINDSGLQPLTLTPAAVSVTVSYNLKTKLFLGTTFFGVTFPSRLSITQTMTSE